MQQGPVERFEDGLREPPFQAPHVSSSSWMRRLASSTAARSSSNFMVSPVLRNVTVGFSSSPERVMRPWLHTVQRENLLFSSVGVMSRLLSTQEDGNDPGQSLTSGRRNFQTSIPAS